MYIILHYVVLCCSVGLAPWKGRGSGGKGAAAASRAPTPFRRSRGERLLCARTRAPANELTTSNDSAAMAKWAHVLPSRTTGTHARATHTHTDARSQLRYTWIAARAAPARTVCFLGTLNGTIS